MEEATYTYDANCGGRPVAVPKFLTGSNGCAAEAPWQADVTPPVYVQSAFQVHAAAGLGEVPMLAVVADKK